MTEEEAIRELAKIVRTPEYFVREHTFTQLGSVTITEALRAGRDDEVEGLIATILDGAFS